MGQMYNMQQVAGLLLVNFVSMTQEWRKAVAMFLYLDITDRDAEKALTMADEMLNAVNNKAFPFNIPKFYGLNGNEPQVDITLDAVYGRVTLLGGIDEQGSVYVMCAVGSADDRKEASAAVDAKMKLVA